jgi:hypothetical protein
MTDTKDPSELDIVTSISVVTAEKAEITLIDDEAKAWDSYVVQGLVTAMILAPERYVAKAVEIADRLLAARRERFNLGNLIKAE